MNSKFFPALLVLFIGSGMTRADADQRPITFDEAARLALDSNADLLTVREQEESERYRAKQALSPSSPVFSILQNDLIGFSPLNKGASTVYQLTYTLGFPGKAFTQAASLRSQAEALRESTLGKEVDTLTSLSNVYISLSSNRQVNTLLTEEKKRTSRLSVLIEKRYSMAQGSQADVLNFRVVAANLDFDLLTNEGEYESLSNQFRDLIHKPGQMDFNPLIPETFPIPKIDQSQDALLDIMLRNRQAIQSAKYSTSAASSALANASLAALPDFNFTAGMNIYNFAAATPVPGVTRDYIAGVGIAIPIFFPFNEFSGMQAARHDHAAAQYTEDSTVISSKSGLVDLLEKFRRAEREYANLHDLVLPAAEASYELTQKLYSVGRADYLGLKESRGAWIQAKRDTLDRKTNLALLYNQIVQQLGCDLSRKSGPHACG